MRSWVWFRPPHPPTTVEVRPKKMSSVGTVEFSWKISAKGASFCQVDRIIPVVRSKPCRTSGSQKWVGASPTFNASAMVTTVVVSGWESCRMFHSPVIHAFIVLAKRIMAAAVAWVRKYLVVASTARGWWCCAISGIMARVLISKPIQARSQCELAKVIVVPRPRPINSTVRI